LSSAEKEKFDSAIDKANAVKRGVIESFFAVQSNLDLLTSGQKAQVEDYLKLTKNGKEQKAASIFENVFEPTLESLRRVKKAEEVGRANNGYATGTKWEDDYKQRLVKNARKTHLGEKETK
jgi:NADH:ubiquinone oxidoreductase subunit F (NADH-binding)